MQSPSIQHLFPQKRLVVNWYSYRLLKGNAADITENSFVTASREPHNKPIRNAETGSECHESPANHSARSNPAAKPRPKLIQDTAVSHVAIGSFFPWRLGLAYNMDMYGDLQNEAAVTEHLSQHLQRLQHLTSAGVHLLLFTDCRVAGATLDKCLGQLGVGRTRRPWPHTSLHLFERPFPHRQQ